MKLNSEQKLRSRLGEFYPFKSHYLDLDGLNYHYLDEGPKDAPALVLFHGNPTWSIYWRKLVGELSKNYRVIAMDHIGCGFSSKPQDYKYQLRNHIFNGTRLIDHLGLEKFSVFVHDWGGAIGMGVAEQFPEKIESFVVFNSAAFFSSNIPKRIAVCRWPVFGKLAIKGMNAFAKGATLMATEKGFSSKLKKAYTAPYDNYKNRIATYEFVQDIPMEKNHPTRETIDAVELGLEQFSDRPMMLIWGEKDWCFDLTFYKTWTEKFPKAQSMMLRDSGHYVVEDGFDDYIDSLKDFLKTNLGVKSDNS